MLELGSAAPSFELEGSRGEAVSMESLAGRFAVIVFYPKNNTSG